MSLGVNFLISLTLTIYSKLTVWTAKFYTEFAHKRGTPLIFDCCGISRNYFCNTSQKGSMSQALLLSRKPVQKWKDSCHYETFLHFELNNRKGITCKKSWHNCSPASILICYLLMVRKKVSKVSMVSNGVF